MSLRGVGAQVEIETKLTLRRGESLIVTLGIPVGILVFFGNVDLVDTGYRDPLDFLVPGVLALAVMSTAMVSLGIATGFERRYGVLKRLGSTPLGRSGLLTAKTLTVVTVEVIQAVIIVIAALLLGWSPAGGIAAAVLVMIIGTIAFSGLGLLMAGTLRAEATLAVANGGYLLLLVLGGMAYPLSKLPLALQDVARVLPAAPLAECLRGALTGTGIPGARLSILIGWAVLAPLLAARSFRWEE
ncbi:MAG: type transport system permease protein [Actinomycetota bacterium]|jgi:ABC-2 type transport system permease protein|nr:type transport system permease protein [Actinomycetota bacterium]MDQ1498162.1 type transport system permease protein [Actinomycetota bacterium]MDQ1503474.1 type transport system permease protein [Actinomycetota bacterium]